MIKRFRFFDSEVEATEYAGHVPHIAASRPVRIAVCHSLPDVIAEQRHRAVVIEWFEQHPTHGRSIDPGDLEAEEVVVRGSDWLEARWRGGGPKIKHMAIAKRASHLTPEAFSQLWRRRAGTVRTSGTGPIAIPDEARGRAYIQNHPLPRSGDDWLYDAVNEVYFDDIESLRLRIDWFAANLGDRTEDDLVSTSSFLAVREEILLSNR